MNTRYLSSVLLFLVGLLAMPQSLSAVSVLCSPVGFQLVPVVPRIRPVAGNPFRNRQDDANQEGVVSDDPVSDDPMSASRFVPDPTSVFVAPSREFIRPLIRAMRIHQEGDDVHAAELIGQFLVDLGDEDFLIFNDKAQGTAASVSSIANEMLASLPESAIDAYRVRFGVPARQRLNLAIAESNYFEIAQVKQRFLYTDSGLDAAMLLGHYHFDAGRMLLAADSFQTALDLGKKRRKPDVNLSIMTAVSWVLARRPTLGEAVMRDLAKTNGGKFRVGDQEVAIDDGQPLAAIETFVGGGSLDSSSTVDQWLLVGGNARRNVTTVDGFPVGLPLWEVSVDASRADLQKIKSTRERITSEDTVSSSNSLVPAHVPLIVDGLVLVGNKNRIQAVDFNSGKRVWAVKASDSGTDAPNKPAGILVQKIQLGRVSVSSLTFVDRTPWSDFLRGHASSDGKFIFRVVKSAVDPKNNAIGQLRFNTVSRVKTTNNRLQAIDVQREGELIWEAGGGKTTGDPRLTQVNFLGAPLPVGDQLYAIGKRLEEVILVVLNSEDGKLLWIQSLATDENLSRSRYSRTSTTKSDYSFTPSYSDGILVCPTGKSALVAIDAIGRRLLWGMQTNIGKTPRSTSANKLAALQNPQVFIENSRIVAFDVGSEPRLLAMDLLNGSPLMKIGKAGVQCREVLHVANIDEDQVVLVEKKRVRAISTDSGHKLWEASIVDYGQPTGRGYVSQSGAGTERRSALYLPTEGNMIVKIDLELGKVVDGIRGDQSFGNLIVHQGRVISRRETSVACFELDSKVMAELKSATDKNGRIVQLSPSQKIKQAALLRNQGKARQAIELLKTIDQSEWSGRFKVEFLQNAMLMFDSDPEFALKLFKEHENWFQFETNPELFLGYVELLVKSNLVDDMLKQLFDGDSFFVPFESAEETVLFQRPIAGYNFPKPKAQVGKDAVNGAGEANGENDDSDQQDGKGPLDDAGDGKALSFLERQKKFSKSRITFDRNHWAKTQLIRAVREYPESKAKIQIAIQQRLEATEVLDVIQRHRLFRQFPLELVAPQSRFELAQQLIAKGHVAEAENMFASLVGGLPREVKQVETLGVEGGFSKDSLVGLWQEIRDAQYDTKAKLAVGGVKVEPSIGQGAGRVSINAIRLPSQFQRDYPTRVETRGELAGQLFEGKHFSIWGYGQEIEILDAYGNTEVRFPVFEDSPNNLISLKNGSGWIQANHSLAVLRQKNVVLAIDLSKLELGQPSVLWHKNVTARLTGRTDVAGEMDLLISRRLPTEDITASFPTTGCCCFIDMGKLVCVDAFTGEMLWARTKDDKHTGVLSNGSRVMTMDSKQAVCSVFDVRTGERIRTETISDLTQSLWSIDGASFVSSSSAAEDRLEGLEAVVDYRTEVKADKESKDGGRINEPKSRLSKSGKSGKPGKSGRFLSRYNVLDNDFVWKKVFGADVKMCRLAGDRFLVLSADNQIYVFDSKTGKELAKLPSGLTRAERKKIRYVGAVEHAGQDLVALATVKTSSISTPAYLVRNSRSLSTFFSGHLLLLSRGDIQPVWARPAEVTGFHLLPMLPSTSPLLLLNRSIGSSRISSNPRPIDPPVISSGSIQFLGIDMRTGKVALNKILGPFSNLRFGSPTFDPVAGTIDMKFPGWEIKLNMEQSQDEPPSPVASVTQDNPVPRNHKAGQTVAEAPGDKFDMEQANQRLVREAQEYEASLEQKRAEERAQLKSESGQAQ